jgi:hypothetical protein
LKPDANRVEDAFAVQNFHPTTGAPNSQGGLTGTNIADLSFTCTTGTPAAPDSVVATPDFERSCMKVRWKDMANNEVAFRVDRRVAGADQWVTVAYRPAHVTGSVVTNWQMKDLGTSPAGCFHPGTIDLNPQEWYDYLAVPGEFYEYRVAAINCGNGDEGAAPITPVVVFPVSVQSQKSAISFGIFPNPAENYLEIHSDKSLLNASYKIMDMAGRTISTGTFKENQNRLDVSGLASGIHVISIHTGNTRVTRRFVKN